MKFRFMLIVGLIVLMTMALFAGETGKISGVVRDAETGEVLPGANVIIRSIAGENRDIPLPTPLGAATDMDGLYFIINIPPGRYNVSASFMGYQEAIQTKVQVRVDKTTPLDFALNIQSLEGEEVVVTAYKANTVEVDLTATKQTYTIDEVQSVAGVADISDILQLQADVVDDHFRGGRVGESLYLISGSTIVNPLNNRRAFSPIVTGLQEVEVYTSGFSAEYGNAQSGVVNMVTKEGGATWQTRAEVSSYLPYYKTWGGSVYSPDNLHYYNDLINTEEWLKENPTQPGKPLWDLGYGAPTYLPPRVEWPPNPLTRQDSLAMAELGRIQWLLSNRDAGMEYNNTLDYRLDFSTGGPLTDNASIFIAARQNVINPIVPTPQKDYERQVMSNLTWRPNKDDKIKFSYIYDNGLENEIGSQFLRWTFDRTLSVNKVMTTSRQYGAEWLHTFTPRTFMDWKLKVLDILTEERIELLADGQFLEDYSNRRNWVDYTDPSYHRVGRPTDDRGDEKALTYDLNGSITSQVNRNNLIKGGLQFTYFDIDVDYDMNVTNEGSYRKVEFNAFPYEGALYVQDKMEFEGLIANIGLRYDFYNLNANYFADQYSPLRNPNYDPTKPYLERGQYYDPELAAKKKTELYTRLQPRIGISFPVSETSVFHLNYGTFTQRPNFNQIYYSQLTMFNEIEVIGNPRLRPENTRAYDIGIVQGLPGDFFLDVSAYYKDVTDLVETAYFFDEQQSVYRTYINKDYADIKGFHVNLEKKQGNVRGYIRYNYESATGKSSNDLSAPVSYFEQPAEGQEAVDLPDPEDIYLDYDRTHKAVVNLRFITPRTFGFSVGLSKPLADMSLSSTFRYMTGRPYTWDETGKGLQYNQRTPDEYNLRMRLEKKIRFGYNSMTAYVEVFNLLNHKVFHYSRTFQDERNVVIWEKQNDTIEDYTEYAPYITSQRLYIFNNEPRHYRLGLIFNF
jgi:outer membrane receptor protein involved in Fe transport